jgi:RNA polymerase sigma-70 factor (ECF subfamily)
MHSAQSMSYWQSAYRDHGPAVLAYLASRIRRDEAEDLLQETFVRAIRATGSLRDEQKLRPYLLTIAHNLMVNNVRRRRTPLFSELPSTDDGRSEIDQQASDATSPEEEANLNRLEDRLHSALESMPLEHRLAFEHAVLLQEPYRDIARATGWSLAKVKINVYRARRKAVESLREFLPYPRADDAAGTTELPRH